MAKAKSVYRCEQCGADHSKWAGQCSECGEWNSLVEVSIAPAVTHRAQPKMGGGYAGQAAAISTLNQISVSHETRLATGIGEFDPFLEPWPLSVQYDDDIPEPVSYTHLTLPTKA